jgi:DUF1009 family protein
VLKDHGITVDEFHMRCCLSWWRGPGVLTDARPRAAMLADFEFGYRIADAIAGVDVGQTVVVKDRAVVAVEGMEGNRRGDRARGPAGGARLPRGESGQAFPGHAI